MKTQLAQLGIKAKGLILRNLTPDECIKEALENKEGVLAKNGSLSVGTGERTGRSPKDRFFVTGDFYEKEIYWNNHNLPTDPKMFDRNALQRGVAGQSGLQLFFTESARPFCLYVVLGSHIDRVELVAKVNEVLATLVIS